jgi:hypothetical protein
MLKFSDEFPPQIHNTVEYNEYIMSNIKHLSLLMRKNPVPPTKCSDNLLSTEDKWFVC